MGNNLLSCRLSASAIFEQLNLQHSWLISFPFTNTIFLNIKLQGSTFTLIRTLYFDRVHQEI